MNIIIWLGGTLVMLGVLPLVLLALSEIWNYINRVTDTNFSEPYYKLRVALGAMPIPSNDTDFRSFINNVVLLFLGVFTVIVETNQQQGAHFLMVPAVCVGVFWAMRLLRMFADVTKGLSRDSESGKLKRIEKIEAEMQSLKASLK